MKLTSPGFREGRHRLSVAHLLVALVAMFLVQPLVDPLPFGDLLESVVFSLVLLAAVNAVGGRRKTQFVAALLVAPALLTRWLDHLWPGLLPIDLSVVAALFFVVFVTGHLLRFVVKAPVVNLEVLCAAISVYLLLAVAWGSFYTLLARWDPGAFVFTDPSDAKAKLEGFLALYFSVQVITTVTLGDIMPISNTARMTVLAEATVGVFYMAILISRLVGAYTSDPPDTNAGDDNSLDGGDAR